MTPMKLVQAEGSALAGLLDETHDIWADGLTRAAYGRYNEAQMRTPWGRHHLHRVALVDDAGRILSSAKRYDHRALLGGREIRMVGIGAVFTPAPMRGRGHARALVDEIVTAAAGEGAELALLFSEIDPDYYAKVGFIPVPRREQTIRTRPFQGAPMVLVRAGVEQDIPAVAALAQTMAAGHRFALAPSEDLVRFSLSKKRLLAGFLPPTALSVEFHIVEEGAGAVAFAILTVTDDDVVLEMCGDRDPSGARVGALLQTLRARTPSEPIPHPTGFLPPGWCPPQLTVEYGAPVREVMMVRPLNGCQLDPPLRESDVLYWHGDLF
jgi:predicted N-acetyltransferase YhbS